MQFEVLTTPRGKIYVNPRYIAGIGFTDEGQLHSAGTGKVRLLHFCGGGMYLIDDTEENLSKCLNTESANAFR